MRVVVILLMLLAAPASAVQICGTTTSWGSDSTDCRLEDSSKPIQIVKAKFYRAFCGTNQPIVLIDSLAVGNSQRVCFNADTSVCVTYFMTQVTVFGRESCQAPISFPNAVSVDHDDRPGIVWGVTTPWHDVGGRVVHEPLPSGKYWRFVNGVARDTTVRR